MKMLTALLVMILAAAVAAVAVGGSGITVEKPSPQDRISYEHILTDSDSVRILLANARLAAVSDTNSMDPVIDKGSILIEISPSGESDISAGDIVTFYRDDRVIVHRVVSTGSDSQGWYAVTRGDNNSMDDGKLRFDDIRGIVVGILY